MKELTNLELLMEYIEQNQYFIGNDLYFIGDDLLAKYNELLQKEKQCNIGGVINWVACKEELPVGDSENVLIVHNGNVQVGWYQKHTKLWWLSITENSKDITHWAELPKPPCL